jgi:hypothetical protein
MVDTVSFMQKPISFRLDYAEDLLAEEPLITRLEPPENQILKFATQSVVKLSAGERARIDASWAEHSKRSYKDHLAFKEEQKRDKERERAKERDRQKGKRILEAYRRNVLAKRIARQPNRYGFFIIE